MKMDLKKHDEYSLIEPQEIYYCETVLQKSIRHNLYPIESLKSVVANKHVFYSYVYLN